MNIVRHGVVLAWSFWITSWLGHNGALATTLTVDLGDSPRATLVGALQRWDQDGNARQKPDAKAKIDAPQRDATAVHTGSNRWVFRDLPPGKYDLLILARDPATDAPLRVEGWSYAPVLEFDPFFPPDATAEQTAREFITDHIAKSRQYENKVAPLYMGGDKQAVRVLMMLIRDQPTSYEPGLGTIRHEIWQYTNKYGGWQKERRTQVLDRLILPVDQLRRWTWLWDPKLGGIDVKGSAMTIKYQLPKGPDNKKLKGLYPY